MRRWAALRKTVPRIARRGYAGPRGPRGGAAREHVGVVGVDGSPAAREALRWGAWHARHVGATIIAVMAWDVPLIYNWEVPDSADFARRTAAGQDAKITEALGDEPGIEIRDRRTDLRGPRPAGRPKSGQGDRQRQGADRLARTVDHGADQPDGLSPAILGNVLEGGREVLDERGQPVTRGPALVELSAHRAAREAVEERRRGTRMVPTGRTVAEEWAHRGRAAMLETFRVRLVVHNGGRGVPLEDRVTIDVGIDSEGVPLDLLDPERFED